MFFGSATSTFSTLSLSFWACSLSPIVTDPYTQKRSPNYISNFISYLYSEIKLILVERVERIGGYGDNPSK